MSEFIKILKSSLKIIREEGFKSYIEHVRTKISRREFKVITPFTTKEYNIDLKKIVENNESKRLKIKSPSQNEISNDELQFGEDYYVFREGEPKSELDDITICTIFSSNYLSHVRTLTNSFLENHPNGKVFAMLVDELDEKYVPEKEKFTTIYLDQIGLPDLHSFLFKYSIMEQNTDVKAHFLKFLFERFNLKKIAYFDPDILFTAPLNNLWSVLDKYSIVLIPHITEPIDDRKKPSEFDLLQAGVYNLGFIALSNDEVSKKLLNWWSKKLMEQGYAQPENGMFVDQKWIDLVPAIFDGVYILKHPGYNSAYWNLKYKEFEIEKNKIYVDKKPLYFFHFSGFVPEELENISKHQNRFRLKNLESIRSLFELYRDLLVKNGYLDCKKMKFHYDYFDNGVKIPPSARRIYANAIKKNLRFGNPFSTGGAKSFIEYLNDGIDDRTPKITRLWYAIFNERRDLQEKYSDVFFSDRIKFIKKIETILKNEYNSDEYFLPSTVIKNFKNFDSEHDKEVIVKETNQTKIDFGINMAGYFQGEFGVAEAGRRYASALKSVDIPHVLNNFSSSAHRNKDEEFSEFKKENPYDINLIAVNADQSKVFYETVGQDYFKNKYNIAIWFWEISDFPEKLSSNFKYYDEIWVASNFIADSISKLSPIPVVKISGPLNSDFSNVESDKEKFGLKNSFVFLFIFDFYSIIERKNPIGLIDAFKNAFQNNDKVRLVIKCTNGDKFPKELQKLEEKCNQNGILLMKDYLNKSDLLTLIASSDCYVSLHRSEGWGLTIAEAMLAKKPVIATAYGGNTDFMNLNNSFPVKYKIVKLEKDYTPYQKGSVWSEPDLEHAAQLMKYVYENQDEVKQIGEKGFEFLKNNYNSEKSGLEIKKRINHIRGAFT